MPRPSTRRPGSAVGQNCPPIFSRTSSCPARSAASSGLQATTSAPYRRRSPTTMQTCFRTAIVRKRIAAILVPLALLVLVGATVVVVNQAFQLVELADRLHPAAGDVVFW